MSKIIYKYDSSQGKVAKTVAAEVSHTTVYEHDSTTGKVKKTDK